MLGSMLKKPSAQQQFDADMDALKSADSDLQKAG